MSEFSLSAAPPLTALVLTALAGSITAPAVQAQVNAAETQCYSQALAFGAGQRDRDRAAYLCEGAISAAPADCYWQALSFGANRREQDRAARLCRGSGAQLQARQPYGFSRGLRGLYQQNLGGGQSRYLNDFENELDQGRLDDGSAAAQCYWSQLGLGASDRDQRRALEACSVQPIVELPTAIRECTLATEQQLGVSRSSALIACTNSGGVY